MDMVQRFGTEVFVSLKNLRTEIDGSVKDAIDAIAETRGMTIRAITEKTFSWLAAQPSEAQAVILGQIPADTNFIELVLRRIASQSQASTPDQASPFDDDDEATGGPLAQIGPKPPKPSTSPGYGRVRSAASNPPKTSPGTKLPKDGKTK